MMLAIPVFLIIVATVVQLLGLSFVVGTEMVHRQVFDDLMTSIHKRSNLSFWWMLLAG